MAKKTVRAKDEVGPPEHPAVRTCATQQVHERLLRTAPGYREARDASENQALRAAMFPVAGRTGCTKIPVVVHVVHKTAAQNISDAQVKSQIDVLTADFRKKNADVSSTPGAFVALATDARVVFELAKTDPSGNPTTGITRTATAVTAFTDDDAVKSSATGGANAWPADKYLNVWVCQLAGGLLGYAQFPGGPAATDGVVVRHSAFGTTGTAAAPFNLGRTATHEVGHWLNLRHIWGDDGTGCSGSDFVTDTPNQAGPNVGVPAFPHVSCGNGPNGDMFMNYMDYVDDAAMVMFSAGQVTRMQATLDGLRSAIGSPTPCGVKSLPKETVKELPKDVVKELPKDGVKDFPKDGAKDLPKDVAKDIPKDGVKDFPKDAVKDFPKDAVKERPKELVKEFPKDLPKERPKEFVKEYAKDLAKDPAFDPKSFVADLPGKAAVDGPKSFVENPIDLPMGGDPLGTGGGPMPFVLGTGVAAGAGPGRAESMSVAEAWARLLEHYARLHAAGLLDASGMAAWQEAAAAYQRLMTGS
jgi:hypothetical protein